MRILVIGGSGQTGGYVIEEALQRGHEVTALVRNPEALPPQRGLTVVKGTPLQLSDVEKAFDPIEGKIPTAVIVTLSSPKIKGSRLMADAHANLISVMRKYKVSKIATLSAFGTGSSLENISIIMRWAIGYTAMGYSYADHNLVDKKLKESELDFILTRASRLTLTEKAPIKFYGNDGTGMGAFAGLGGVSRASVASFLLDAVERSNWDKSTPVISN